MPNSKNVFYCDQLNRANETVSEAHDFFVQIGKLNQSLITAPVPIAGRFNWHLKEIENLRQNLPTSGGQFGTVLEAVYNFATGILNKLSSLEIAALNSKIAESVRRPSRDPPMEMSNGTHFLPSGFIGHPPRPTPSRPLPNGLLGTRPRRPCRFNSSDIDHLFNETDTTVQLLMAINTTNEDEGPCDEEPGIKPESHFQICNRSFWQQDFTQNPMYKKVQFLLGNQISVIDKFVGYAKNLSTTDANFTMECRKFLYSSNIRKIVGMFTSGNINMTSIVSSLFGSSLLSNNKNFSSALSGIFLSGINASQLSEVISGLSSTNIPSWLSGPIGTASPFLSNQLPSSMISLKEALLNNLGRHIPQIGQFLKGLAV